MSCVADAKAAIMKRMSVNVNMPIGVVPEAICSAPGRGRVRAKTRKAADIMACMVTIHQRFVLIMSTKGLQRNFRVHGRYSNDVNIAICPFGTPILANISTDTLFTRKYGIPSTKYSVGIQSQGEIFLEFGIFI